ncbi:conserved hypothetical protein [Taylorella equigenitalis 14/56]|uniref:G domain-containing protein n=1 Tax=Taylorella equigenitalis 14/56 TaxID=1091497 RepID=I7JQ10_9BURK|nr:GTPase/DUF3482 domain-containing protein [Taylorella equigenitalis]CCG18342.1 conserved hypothetical protein [Taylorella equigenitalis 14/56]
MNSNLKLAVVGHTNTGKTSLLRTLLEDKSFGEVEDSPGTTKALEAAVIPLDDCEITLIDTPGFEDSEGLRDYLEQLQSYEDSRLSNQELIKKFLKSPESTRRYAQEARVLHQLLDSTAGLYVIDIRDSVRSKHRDELHIMSMCGRPLIAILNFMHSEDNFKDEWNEALSDNNIHLSIEFDTVAPPIDGTEMLYKKLSIVLSSYDQPLKQLAERVAEQRTSRKKAALSLLAEALVDIASYKYPSKTDEESVRENWEIVQNNVRKREYKFNSDLLKHYRFTEEDYPNKHIPIEGERWGSDLFNPSTLKEISVHVGSGFAAGAMTGMALDVLTAGLSLGTAALFGGIIGSMAGGAAKLGNRLKAKYQGYQELSVDDNVVRLVAIRGLLLIAALDRRGHASTSPVSLPSEYKTLWTKGMPEELSDARGHPEWSSIGGRHKTSEAKREATKGLSKELQKIEIL